MSAINLLNSGVAIYIKLYIKSESDDYSMHFLGKGRVFYFE